MRRDGGAEERKRRRKRNETKKDKVQAQICKREKQCQERRKRRLEEEEGTNLESGVPAACGKSHAVRGDTETADTFVVAFEVSNGFSLETVPDVDDGVVVGGKETAATDGESERRHAAIDVIGLVLDELTVGANVKETAAEIVRTSSKRVSVGKVSGRLKDSFIRSLISVVLS